MRFILSLQLIYMEFRYYIAFFALFNALERIHYSVCVLCNQLSHGLIRQICWRISRHVVFPTASPRSASTRAPPISTTTTSRLWRSFFYVPGDRSKMIEKMATIHVKLDPSQYHSHIPDLVVLDCEDAVALDRKSEARQIISDALSAPGGGKFRVLRNKLQRMLAVRINSTDTSHAIVDLDCVLQAAIQAAAANEGVWPGPDLFCLPKVESVDELAWMASTIDRHLSAASIPKDQLRLGLVAMIESCSAIVNLAAICEGARKLSIPLAGVVFGSDDYCASLGVDRSASNVELAYARNYVPVVARSFGLASIDMVDIDFQNLDNLRQNCQHGAQIGFNGKQTIHPAQLAVVNTSFAPSPSRIEWATALMEEAATHTRDGSDAVGAGAFRFRGRMIDRPTLRQAERTLRLVDLMAMHDTD